MYTFIRVFGILGIFGSLLYLGVSLALQPPTNLLAIFIGLSGLLSSTIILAVGTIGLTVTESRTLLRELLARQMAATPVTAVTMPPESSPPLSSAHKSPSVPSQDVPLSTGNLLGLVILGLMLIGGIIFFAMKG